jgi:nicotinamide riboside transporter PnuC
MDLADVAHGFGLFLWTSMLFPLLQVAGVLLLVLRKPAGWLVLLVEPVLSLVLMGVAGAFSLAVLVLPAVAAYGWWRWRRLSAGGGVLVHPVQRSDWLAAAGLMVLVLFFFGIDVLPMMLMHLPDPGAIAEAAVVSLLTPLLYLGLARGVIEAWWIGVTLSLMGLARLAANANPQVLFALDGIVFTVLLGVLSLYGWSRWREAHAETAAST